MTLSFTVAARFAVMAVLAVAIFALAVAAPAASRIGARALDAPKIGADPSPRAPKG